MMFTNTSIKGSLIIISAERDRHDHVSFGDLGHKKLSQPGLRGRSDVGEGVNWNRVMFSDMTSDKTLLRHVSRDEIYENNMVLTPDRYLNVGAKERLDHFLSRAGADAHAELADLVEMIRPVSLTQDDEGECTLYEASPGDLNERGYVSIPGRTIAVDRGKYNKASNQQLRPGDVLLSIKGNVGVVAMVPPDAPKEGEAGIWTAGQSMMILRPKKRVSMSSLALYEYLSNDTVQEFLKSLAGGAGIQNLAMKDLKSFPVVMPDDEAIRQVEASFSDRQAILDQIGELQAKLVDVRDQGWPHLHLKDDD